MEGSDSGPGFESIALHAVPNIGVSRPPPIQTTIAPQNIIRPRSPTRPSARPLQPPTEPLNPVRGNQQRSWQSLHDEENPPDTGLEEVNDVDIELGRVDDSHTLRGRLRAFVEDPRSSRESFYFAIFIAGMVVFSSVVMVIETLPIIYKSRSVFWFIFETVVVLIFTIEFSLRLYVNSGDRHQLQIFFSSLSTWIDLIAIVPYYVEVIFYGGSIHELQRFTVFRLFRLFRLFRYFRYSSVVQLSIDVMIIAVRKSMEALMALFFFLTIAIVVFSTLMYSVERGTWNEEKGVFVDDEGNPSKFSSIPASFWFATATLTTVGFGDMIPQTWLGRVLTFPIMMCGILIIALPSIVIGRNFSFVLSRLKATRRRMVNPYARQIQPRANNQIANSDDDMSVLFERGLFESDAHLPRHSQVSQTGEDELEEDGEGGPTSAVPAASPIHQNEQVGNGHLDAIKSSNRNASAPAVPLRRDSSLQGPSTSAPVMQTILQMLQQQQQQLNSLQQVLMKSR